MRKQQFFILGIFLFFILVMRLSCYRLFDNRNINIVSSDDESYLAIYLEEEPINYIPEKDSGYTLDLSKSSCTNGVEVSFDYNTWSVKTNYNNYTYQNNERVKCSLYFKKRTFAESLVDCGALNKDAGTCIKENYYLTDEVVDDETTDNNLRYIGADPNNYVSFNNELWRIIGVMNNIDDGTGNKETRVKIIRDESIGNYSWDSSTSDVNDGFGVNEWSQADLMTLMNSGLYWTRGSGLCFNNQNNVTGSCDFTKIGLQEDSKALIDNAVWNLGSNDVEDFSNANVVNFYEWERSNNSGKICSYRLYCTDTVERTAKWTGKVALMYPSDYGYATSGGDTVNRSTCLSGPLDNWDNSGMEECYENSWLYNEIEGEWTLMPRATASAAMHTFYIDDQSQINGSATGFGAEVFPTMYLKNIVKIVGRNGTREDPFRLSGN